MEITHNHNAKSILAKLLAAENISVQHSAAAKTAWFDVENRILMLPLWKQMSNDLYDMLVVHEVGHALDTPNENLKESIQNIAKKHHETVSSKILFAVKNFLNVIEDARIDKRQKRRFPGSRRNYIKGYQELFDRNFFGIANKDVNSLIFIDRLNIYFKGGTFLNIKFTADERPLLKKGEKAETFEEVLALTDEIYALAKKEKEELNSMLQKNMENDSDDDGTSDETSDGNSDSGDTSDDDADDDSGNASDDDAEEKTGDIGDYTGGTDDQSLDDVPESETEKAWQQNSESLLENSDVEYVYGNLPKLVNYNETVIDYKQVLKERNEAFRHIDSEWKNICLKELQEFKTKENAAVSFMVKEFEMRKAADEYLRTSISKTGVIDTNKLHSYKYNDDLFRRITSVASGKNHGFVMFLDWSGSMDPHLEKTVKQLLTLTMFCKRVQVPFEIYSFISPANSCPNTFSKNIKELSLHGFYLRNILSSRMSASELNTSMHHLYMLGKRARIHCDILYGTPLNQAIVAASDVVEKFKARSKVQIVNVVFLTDGESDPFLSNEGMFSRLTSGPAKYILQDEKTKRTYDLGSKYNSYSVLTPTLLRMLRDRTGCNLIGFYIARNNFEKEYKRQNSTFNGKHHDDAKNSWNDNGFFAAVNAGYDEYYIIDSKSFRISTDNLVIGKNATKRKIVSEFIKFSEKKTVSRVLLSRIIKKIAA